ncbi:MAG: hypothetical protein FWJ90_06055 [Actinomadura sp.]
MTMLHIASESSPRKNSSAPAGVGGDAVDQAAQVVRQGVRELRRVAGPLEGSAGVLVPALAGEVERALVQFCGPDRIGRRS